MIGDEIKNSCPLGFFTKDIFRSNKLRVVLQSINLLIKENELIRGNSSALEEANVSIANIER